MPATPQSTATWPALPLAAWEPTYDTLHMYSQIVGKIRLALSPPMNHWWQVPLYLTARGLTTSPIPSGDRTFHADFDFFDHALRIDTSDGQQREVPLGPSVREFYAQTMDTMHSLGIDVEIWTMPVEFANPIPFERDDQHATYEAEHAHRWWALVREVDVVLKEFRARFTGKSSPVQFFWGSFDLAVTRFSGRPAEPPPDADPITRFSYTAEQSNVGFWPGGTWIDGSRIEQPMFFAYAFPEPDGYREQPVRPEAASFDKGLGEYVLSYEDVRGTAEPRQMILDFAQSTYLAGAQLQGWPVEQLELRDVRQRSS